MNKGLKLIAVMRLLRGSVAFCIAILLFYLALNLDQKPINTYQFIEELIKKDVVFEAAFDWISEFYKSQIISIALLVMLLGLIRWFEAYGLWNNKVWGKCTALVTGAIYIPFEINVMYRELSVGMSVILIINALVVMYLAKKLLESKKVLAECESITS